MKRTAGMIITAAMALANISQAELPAKERPDTIMRSAQYLPPPSANPYLGDPRQAEKSRRWTENERWLEHTLAKAGFSADVDAQQEIVELQRAKEEADRAQQEAQKVMADAMTQIQIVQDQNQGGSGGGGGTAGGASRGGSAGGPATSFSYSVDLAPDAPMAPAAPMPPGKRRQAFNFYGSSGGHSDRALVIRSTPMEAKTLAACEEDLNIMGRILEKALDKTGEEDADEQVSAMGIRLVTMSLGSGHAKRLQIEGYGALFMLNVNFPLVGPAAKKAEGETNETSNSTWDEAKHEIYGHPADAEDPTSDPFKAEKFDAKKVEKLKESLLSALKNASNMHNLKGDEYVTVVVASGGGGEGFEMNVIQNRIASLQRSLAAKGGSWSGAGTGGGGGQFGAPVAVSKSTTPETSGGSSTLTIRAKKSDIDAFAKGKLTPEEFRNRASILIY